MGLLDPSGIHDLMSGRRRGVAASLLRGLLLLAEVPYGLGVAQRNRRYDRGRAPVQRVEVPVVSVGNMTTGGTGKTPLVAWLARWFRRHQLRVTVISRGYKAESGARNDEALELEQQLPDVPHLQNADRVAAARLAIEEFECQLILLDDAFQHRRIHRDLDIVLLDAVEPFGYQHLLPRGLLRESLRGLARGDLVVLSRADAVDAARRAAIHDHVQRYAPRAGWVEVSHQPSALFNSSAACVPLDHLGRQPVAAFCGIGNPAGFRHTLQQCGFRVVAFRSFPDHHAYQRGDVQQLVQWSREHGAEALLCTRKDLVKLGVDRLQGIPLWAVGVEMSVDRGQETLEAKLVAVIGQTGPPLAT